MTEGLTVGRVARGAGLTVRALHHFDAIGLVVPHERSPAGYRIYSRTDIERLQEVLFFRELGFGLEEIKAILDRPDYSRAGVLRRQRRLLEARSKRLQRMIVAVDAALEGERMNLHLTSEEMLEVFGDPTHRGKVRETYDLDDGRLLIVATDRISAYDVVLPSGIPDKGAVLTQMAAFWFELTSAVAPNHFIRVADGTAADELAFDLPPELRGRSSIVKKAKRLDVECIARGT
jgi:DNA-binding transcriptional MerR regulator